jgi:predicted TIM-barrel fold metal-dependent hydrolase
MIDAHIHVVPPNLPGVGPLSPLLGEPPDSLAAALRHEMESAGISHALAMGSYSATPDDPLGVAATLHLAERVPGLSAIGIADPLRSDPDHLRRVAAVLAGGQVRALKAYLGYLPCGPDHPGYRPYYELAERFRVPVIFHTGDTYSPRARLRFARPLLVDDVAVDHPQVRFVLAHCGNPWLLDAAEVIYKNVNVWADLSGLAVGAVDGEGQREALNDTTEALRRAFRYAERPNRFLYASDWPLVPMAAYRDFIRQALPEAHHAHIFEDNARLLFRL